METININGTENVKAEEVRSIESYANWKHVCIIATNGWIFEGYQDADLATGAGNIGLADAHVVRSWSNGLGIGGLTDPAHKDEYTLDAIGSIEVFTDKTISVIELRW